MSSLATMRRYRQRVPGLPLDRYVAALWESEGESGAGYERLLPTGSPGLVIRLDQEPLRRYDDRCQNGRSFDDAIFSGAHSRPFVKAMYRRSSVVGVSFQPAAAALFFREPFDELANEHLEAELVWGADIRRLRERLLKARSTRERFDMVEKALLVRLTTASPQLQIVLRAAEVFARQPTVARVREVGDATGYGPKQFIKLFQSYVGLTPKAFCRVLRFQEVLRRCSAGRPVAWTSLALDCGYYDQSHLIRDFQEFAGVSPGSYRPAGPDRPNHIVLDV